MKDAVFLFIFVFVIFMMIFFGMRMALKKGFGPPDKSPQIEDRARMISEQRQRMECMQRQQKDFMRHHKQRTRDLRR